ncbi:carboxypeptidase-like regulatory domain-containing protein [Solirubrobacter ginsenosidimutans]|uniref:Carboxypeptidase-like regulatory domain-containing protein n=1 Tax=Solirubrobacter ginsenosidimutans TaxID=490573 RepID=A0A9X3N0J9_9ACTN|nr:carboxypeptidase-like regulatory domain-containing protein [Solirubrobacter ginsenosidimutans]MDA0166446.1 carboxypeptidase-like regulatory domain-containing protein [Solirubrobacter ginsenosidimutans]
MEHSSDQAGYALIEVIVSAAVLALLALAVLSGIDGASLSTAREKARAVAGSLAEQDQERLRSYRFDALATVPQANPVTIDNVTYSIKSEASWITDDANAVPACGTAAQKQAEYLRIVSTVTSTIVGSRIAPVRIESMVAPSVVYGQDHGTLAVRVVDRAGVGVPSMTVNAKADDGTPLTPAVTNGQGCALFRSIPVGAYTVGVNTSGWISKAGNQLLETTTTVNPNYINNVSLTYDRKVNMKITVKTLHPGDTFSPTASTAVASQALSVSDQAADTAVLRTFKPVAPATVATVFDSPDLFPYYNSPYSYFTGDCGYMSPTKASSGFSTYFTTVNALAAVQGDPTVFQPQQATVFQPALNVRLLKDSKGTALSTTTTTSTIQVYAKLVKPSGSTDTCVSAYSTYFPLALKDWPTATYGPKPAGANATTNFVAQNVTAFDAGLPFGTYTLCFLDQTYTTKKTYTPSDYVNTAPSGRASTLELSPTTGNWVTASTC